MLVYLHYIYPLNWLAFNFFKTVLLAIYKPPKKSRTRNLLNIMIWVIWLSRNPPKITRLRHVHCGASLSKKHGKSAICRYIVPYCVRVDLLFLPRGSYITIHSEFESFLWLISFETHPGEEMLPVGQADWKKMTGKVGGF